MRLEIVERIKQQRSEIEDAITIRAFEVATPSGSEAAGYVEGLRAAIAAAVEYALAAIEHGAEHVGPIPPAILGQARSAARSRVGLEVVLRRYAAGYSALGDFLQREGSRLPSGPGEELYTLQKDLTILFDRLVEVVSKEYRNEADRPLKPPARRNAELLAQLIAGEMIDTSEIDYDFEGYHLGAVASGSCALTLLRQMASIMNRRLLLLEEGGAVFSAWLGGRNAFERDELTGLDDLCWPGDASVVIGGPAPGLVGWRLTHRQAKATRSVALRRPQRLTRYADVGLLATIARDLDLTHHLSSTYIEPLTRERDGGAGMRRTLQAFFAAGRNASSAAAALGIGRQTVTNRLRAYEEQISGSLDVRGAEVELALRLAELKAELDTSEAP